MKLRKPVKLQVKFHSTPFIGFVSLAHEYLLHFLITLRYLLRVN